MAANMDNLSISATVAQWSKRHTCTVV